MTASITIQTDLRTATAPTAATAAKAASRSVDHTGTMSAAREAISQAKAILTTALAATDASDPLAAKLANILLSLS